MAKLLDTVASKVAGGSEDEKKLLYTEVIQLNKDMFKIGLKGFCIMDTLTAAQTVNIQSLLSLPMNKVRNLCISLSKLNINIFPLERKMRGEGSLNITC